MFRVDANAQLYNTFSAEQSYNFLTYRQALTKAGVGKFLDRAVTAQLEKVHAEAMKYGAKYIP